MASIQIKSEISINELLNSVEQLSAKEIDKLIKKLATIQIKRKIPQSSKIETQLIKKITKRLSKTRQTKYEYLTQRRIAEIITGKELTELSNLIDLIEKIESDKTQAIFTLAQIRGITPAQLMTSFQ